MRGRATGLGRLSVRHPKPHASQSRRKMNRWFRFYGDAINEPKLVRLTDRQHRLWVGLLCIASKYDGELPTIDDIAIMLRTSPGSLTAVIKTLIAGGLLDEDGGR